MSRSCTRPRRCWPPGPTSGCSAPRPPCWQRQAGGRHLRRAHRRRQEPDQPAGRPAAAGRRPARRPGPPPHALRRPGADADPAVRDPGRHRRQQPDHRGAGGVRGAGPPGHGHVRRRRLPRDPGPSRARGGCDRLGRRQQRLPVLRPRPAHHRGRPAAARPRAALPPGRDQPAHGRCGGDQQGRQRRAGRGRRRRRQRRRRQPHGHRHQGRLPGGAGAGTVGGRRPGPGRGGRPDPDPRRHALWRRDRGRPPGRGGQLRRPPALRGRLDRRDLPRLPGHRAGPAGHGLQPAPDPRSCGPPSTPPTATWS